MGRERRNVGTKGFSKRGKEGRGRPAHHPRRHASCLYRCYCDGRRPLLAERRLTAFAPSPYLPLPLPQPPSALPLYAGHYDECCSLLAERKRVLSSQLVSRLKTSVSACRSSLDLSGSPSLREPANTHSPAAVPPSLLVAATPYALLPHLPASPIGRLFTSPLSPPPHR